MALKTCINMACASALLLMLLACGSQTKTGPHRLSGQVCYLRRAGGEVTAAPHGEGDEGFPPDDSMAGDALPAS